MIRSHQVATMALLALTISVAGCGGGDGLDRQAVTGTVTLDGQPLETGLITFDPASATAETSTATEIVNGTYTFSSQTGPVPGEYRVVINSSGGEMVEPPAGQAPGDTYLPPPEEKVPRKYNSQTTLTATVASGSNEPINFELTSD
ncbi:hypothetical protein [Tautonia rosea]|uniref:hypothetical protein n=1 Tax=Tautonia rosea TaxID=2728037 RepID=UPI0014762CA0|nr:hypothetical protein [Tautonia rosea]